MYIEQHMTTLFITYKDVCERAQKSTDQTILQKFHEQKNFAAAFQLIFKFKNPRMASLILNNWEKAIEEEIWACEDLIDSEETYQIKRINLKELTVMANVGRYSINKLKMSPAFAMAFTLGLYYANFIFEQTGLNLTLSEIYNIIPKYIQTKNGCKLFKKRFFEDGTDKAILKILFNN
tara:strand:+ start:517 stop:1050 length:534 start_codon:yes stop_codon:yes gene_type:complete